MTICLFTVGTISEDNIPGVLVLSFVLKILQSDNTGILSLKLTHKDN